MLAISLIITAIISTISLGNTQNNIDDTPLLCKTIQFNYTLTETGCYPKVIRNNFCYGQCRSHFFPRVKSLGIPTYSCSACYPVVKKTKRFYLKCPRMYGMRFKEMSVMMIGKCACKSTRCPRWYNWRPDKMNWFGHFLQTRRKIWIWSVLSVE